MDRNTAATRRQRRCGETIEEEPRPVVLRFGLYSVREGSCFDCQIANHKSFDYNPNTLVFVIRMPTSVHEGLIQSFGLEIMGQLWKTRDTHDSAAVLLGKIQSMGSTSIRLKDGVRHDPDASFRHHDARYPGVVIEVANTQQKNTSQD